MKHFTLCLCIALFALGCTSNPNTQAKELRSLYSEAQVQSAAICADKSVDHVKCAALQERIASLEPYVAAVEVAAAVATDNPGGQINFEVLWAQNKPKVEALLLDLVLKKYLGTVPTK